MGDAQTVFHTILDEGQQIATADNRAWAVLIDWLTSEQRVAIQERSDFTTGCFDRRIAFAMGRRELKCLEQRLRKVEWTADTANRIADCYCLRDLRSPEKLFIAFDVISRLVRLPVTEDIVVGLAVETPT